MADIVLDMNALRLLLDSEYVNGVIEKLKKLFKTENDLFILKKNGLRR